MHGRDDDLRFTASAEPSALASLRRRLDAFLDAASAPEDLRFDVTLAVSEAANNVLQHAYRHRSAPGRLTVTGVVADGEIRIVVGDDGDGLAPRPDSPGAGLGLPLIARLSHDLSVATREEGGTVVTMVWRTAA
jgi:serine/threonine-protein kinase RsbW/stage II sporulation protein AB (anti-sigma F factor)